MFLKLVSFFFIFCTVNNVESKDDNTCLTKGAELESRFNSLFLLNDVFKNVFVRKDLDKYCANAQNVVINLKEFKKMNCTNKLTSQIINFVVPKVRQFIKLRCSDHPADSLELLKCANEKNRPALRKCFDDYATVIKYTANKVEEPTKLLTLSCCNYQNMLKCLKSKEFKDCGEIRSSTLISNTIQSILADAFDLICGKFSTGYCQSEGIFKELGKIKYVDKSEEFLIVPVLRIADKLVSA